MSWGLYIDNLVYPGDVKDAAIVGFQSGEEQVWAAKADGMFSGITVNEIKQLMEKDRGTCLSKGVTLGNVKCAMLRDKLYEEGDNTVDLRTKTTETESETYNICVAKSNKALIIIMGNKNVGGGTLNKRAYDMAKHLRQAGY